MSWGLSAMPTLCIRDSRIAIEATALPLGTPNAINEMSVLLHMCRRFIEKLVNGSKGPFKVFEMSARFLQRQFHTGFRPLISGK